MVMLGGLGYDRTVKKQSERLLVSKMNETGRHPPAFQAART
jgi:hypothetical protein